VNGEILVIGAGIAGLTTALLLQRAGVSVEVVDRAAGCLAAGAGITLHPNALVLLEQACPQLWTEGMPIERQVTIDSDGSIATVDWRRVWPGGKIPLAIHRQRLAAALLACLADGTVRWSVRPRDLAQDGDGVLVTAADGDRRRYRLVIGADGIGSWTRGFVDPDATPGYSGETYRRAVVAATPPLDLADWHVWRSPGHFFGVLPLGHGQVHVFLESAEPAAGRAHLVRDDAHPSAAFGGAFADLLSALPGGFTVDVRPAFGLLARRWARGRVGILGDAAHAVSPATTQGGALGIEDAAVLADVVVAHGPTPAALREFELRRAPRVVAFQRLARLHTALLHSLRSHPGELTSGCARPGGGTDPVAWYRRLYGPLMTDP
jgi:2-polyprenyl-6-methoxyphenol hydroxylase-like FAD-dependent oxidoreductase